MIVLIKCVVRRQSSCAFQKMTRQRREQGVRPIHFFHLIFSRWARYLFLWLYFHLFVAKCNIVGIMSVNTSRCLLFFITLLFGIDPAWWMNCFRWTIFFEHVIAKRLRIGDFIKDNWENTHSAAADECGKHKITFVNIIKLGNIGLPKAFFVLLTCFQKVFTSIWFWQHLPLCIINWPQIVFQIRK
jgi:hypothetical protein